METVGSFIEHSDCEVSADCIL